MKIDYKLERVFPLMFLIIGITFFVSGLLLLGTFNSNAKAGPVILIIGTVIIFTRKGTLIDFNDRRIKHYIGLFFIKIGSWKTLENYSFISILHLNQKSYGYSRSGVQFTERKKIYRICFLNKTHRERLKIKDFNHLESAELEAENIAKNMGFEFVKYNPI